MGVHCTRRGRRAWLAAGLTLGLTLALAPASHAQGTETRITGRIVDGTEHLPIPAAVVLVTGTTIGANTTDSGTFVLRVPPDARTLSVRRIGYLAQTVAITPGKTEYVIALQKDVLRLETQVVTGVATSVASQNAANAVAVVNAADVTQVPAPTMENSIQGKVPGAVIQSNNGGAPGGGLQIQIRGITSINGNTAPLYVIDGVVVDNETVNEGANAISQGGGGMTQTGANAPGAPSPQDNGVNRIADINPDDIENIEILKGASASAIYGSKASAGVVIITTKKGTSGKPTWNVSQQVGHFGLENEYPIRQFPTLAGAQAWYVNDVKGDTKPAAIAADNATIASEYAGPQNYQSQLFGNGQAAYQTAISVSGTSGQTQFYLSGLSKYDNGIMLNTGYNKQSIRSNVTEQFSSALSVTANLNYIHDMTRRGITGNDNVGMSPYNVFSYTPAFMALSQPLADGTYEFNPYGSANPFADAQEMQTPEEVSRFIGGGNINWTPWKTEHQSIQLNFAGGADLASVHDLLYAPPNLQVEQEVPTGLPGASVSNVAQINYLNYSINLIHHYEGLSWLDATTAVGFQRDRRSNANPVTIGYNLLAGVNAPTVGTVQNNYFYETEQLDQSLYAQEQILTLNNRLTLTAGVTAERSTNDGDVAKFYYYPHYSGSYRVPSFASFIDDIKLRLAYGQSGNLAPYGSRYTGLNQTLLAGVNGVADNINLGDANIKPESEQETETGFDVTMFHSRAQFSATIYQKRLTSLLLQQGVAPSYGYSTQYINGGEFTNQGIELSLTGTPVQLRNGFTWIATTTFFRNYSNVNNLPGAPFYTGFGLSGANFLAPGRSVSEVVNPGISLPSGLPMQVGDMYPSFDMGLSNEFTWKGFRVYGFLDWSRGADVINLTDLYFDTGKQLYADSAVSANRLAAFGAGGTPYLEGASFLKVRQLTVSYTLSPRVVNSIGFGRLTSARINLSGYNLWGVYKYPGLDPEVNFDGAVNVGRGVDITPYPPARSYYLGLNLGL